MPETVFNLYEARNRLSKLVDRAARGEEIVIAKAGHPMAKLVPFEPPKAKRRPGGWEGKVWMADDFDTPLLEELQSAFEGREDVGAELPAIRPPVRGR